MSVRSDVCAAALAGLLFVAAEAAVALAWPSPLDPSPTPAQVLSAAVALAVLLAAITRLFRRPLGSRAPLLAALLWVAVWGPEGPRSAGIAPERGWIAVAVVLAVVMGAGAWRPRAALWLTVAGAAFVPSFRLRGDALAGHASVVGPRPDLLLLTVDTVRADAGLLQAADLPPAEGWRHYTAAIAPAPWTLPSFYSVMTGLSVREHGGGLPLEGGFSRPAMPAVLLAERLHDAGYATIAVVSNPHLRADPAFERGFERWLHADTAREPLVLVHNVAELWHRRTGWPGRLRHQRDARAVAAALAEWGRADGRPRFLWVHLLGPHEYQRDPASPPPGWRPGDDALLAEQYAGNVAATRAVCLDLLAAIGDAAVAVVADHGEAFGEGGMVGHGHALQDAELAVPLVVRLPGVEGGVFEGQVAVADVGATLAQAAGAVGVQGRSLLLGPREEVEVSGVRDDLSAAAVRSSAGAYRPAPAPRPGPALALDPRLEAQLRELGYLER